MRSFEQILWFYLLLCPSDPDSSPLDEATPLPCPPRLIYLFPGARIMGRLLSITFSLPWFQCHHHQLP